MSGTTLPVVVDASGPYPQSPVALRNMLLAIVQATNPGYTADLPGSLIEDISSTDVGALSLCDSAVVETINSLTPYGANAFILNQLGAIYGVPRGVGSNTSVEVVFSGPPGFVIAKGFTVSDGTYQYVAQEGSIIQSTGASPSVFCLATAAGSWAVVANTVTQFATSVPADILPYLSVTNPVAGTPATDAQTVEDYRSQVLQAGQAPVQGTATYLKSLLRAIPGVVERSISVRRTLDPSGDYGYEVLVSGGDPYLVGNAIFCAIVDVNELLGSTIRILGITNANPGVVQTEIYHGLATGQNNVRIADVVGMTGVNGGPYTATVIDDYHFSFGVDTTASGSWVSGGVVTPNARNDIVSINDFPDVYPIPFVRPLQQNVSLTLLWNTTSLNSVSDTAIAQLGAPALAAYINSLPTGAPMNLYVLQDTFQAAVSSVLTPALLTRIDFSSITIDGTSVSPTPSGTGILPGDPESFFVTSTSSISISRG